MVVPIAKQVGEAGAPQVDFLVTLDMANRIAAVEQSEKSRVIRDFLWAAMREKQDVQETVEPTEQPPAVQPAPVITQENRTETENLSLSPFKLRRQEHPAHRSRRGAVLGGEGCGGGAGI